MSLTKQGVNVMNRTFLLPLLVACVAIVAVSLLTPPPSAEICGTFEQVRHTK